MPDPARAEELEPGDVVHHPSGAAVKHDENVWQFEPTGEWWCDRQVNILLDTGAVVAESSEQANA